MTRYSASLYIPVLTFYLPHRQERSELECIMQHIFSGKSNCSKNGESGMECRGVNRSLTNSKANSPVSDSVIGHYHSLSTLDPGNHVFKRISI